MSNFINPHTGARGTPPMQNNNRPMQTNMLSNPPPGMTYVNTPQGIMLMPQNPMYPQQNMPMIQNNMMPQYGNQAMMPMSQVPPQYQQVPMAQNNMMPQYGNQAMMPMSQVPPQYQQVPMAQNNMGQRYVQQPMYPNSGMMPMGQNMQPTQGVTSERFGSPSGNINSYESNGTDNRYQTPSNQQLPGDAEMNYQKCQPYVIDLSRSISFKCGAKLTLNTHMLKVENNNIFVTEDFTIADCLQEAVEGIIELAYSRDKVTLLTVTPVIIINSFYRTVNQSTINELVKNSVTDVYRLLKAKYVASTTRYEINLYETLDRILTDYINEYLITKTTTGGNIDSFIEDFNDLLKALDKSGKDVANDLIDNLNTLLINIHNNIGLVHDVNGVNEKEDLACVPEEYHICYVDKLSKELGMENVPSSITLIKDCIPNMFIISSIKEVCQKADTNSFIMTTIDKRTYMCYLSSNKNDTYIKMVG